MRIGLLEAISASFARYRRIGFASGPSLNLATMLERVSMSHVWRTPRSGIMVRYVARKIEPPSTRFMRLLSWDR